MDALKQAQLFQGLSGNYVLQEWLKEEQDKVLKTLSAANEPALLYRAQGEYQRLEKFIELCKKSRDTPLR